MIVLTRFLGVALEGTQFIKLQFEIGIDKISLPSSTMPKKIRIF